MPILIVSTKTDDITRAFMRRFGTAILLNESDPDILVWLCKNIPEPDVISIQNHSGVLCSSFFAL